MAKQSTLPGGLLCFFAGSLLMQKVPSHSQEGTVLFGFMR